MKDAGLSIREDAMGNILGRWQGSDSSAGKHTLSADCGRPGDSLVVLDQHSCAVPDTQSGSVSSSTSTVQDCKRACLD